MKIKEVPQDDDNLFEGKMRELQYAVDENGNYKAVKSVGWKPKNEMLIDALETAKEEANEAYQLYKENLKSPLFYFMKKNLMDIKTLADYMGIWRVFVRRHFKPKIFKKLSDKTLKKYADLFKLRNIDELIHPKQDN